MFVVNIIGYDYSFNYVGVEGRGVIKIPFDHRPYRVPDDIPEFKEFREVMFVDGDKKEEPTPKDVRSDFSVSSGLMPATVNYSGYVNDVPQTALEKLTNEDEVKPVVESKTENVVDESKVKKTTYRYTVKVIWRFQEWEMKVGFKKNNKPVDSEVLLILD